MKANLKSALVLIAGCSLYAGSANAATIYVQAGAGHPHQGPGTFEWANEWTPTNHWTITDGRSISTVFGNGTWDTPVPISLTNVTWNIVALGTNNGAVVTNRICTFDSGGNFFSCGATVSLGATSATFVPSDGSMYSQSFWACAPGVEFCGGGTLFHVKAFE